MLEELEQLFVSYGEKGTGQSRKYLHDAEEAKPYGQEPGTFTPWTELTGESDMLFYEGLHGAYADDKINVASKVDLLIGVVPIAHRLTRYEPSIFKRVVFHVVSLLALIGFCAFAWFLWERYIPREPAVPAPLSYPVAPVPSAVP